MTVKEALDAGYKARWRRYAKIGETILMEKSAFGECVMVTLQNTAELRAAGFRFPYERRGQWTHEPAPVTIYYPLAR